MSIPSADHTIYSFITLCLKEQGDIAGRKEITAQHRGGWEKKGKSGMPSSTETYLCDRFMAREQGSYLGVEDKEAWVSHSTQPPLPSLPPVHPTYTTHKQQAAPTSCGGSTIQFLTYPLMIAFTPLLSCLCSTATSTPSWRSPRGLTHKGRAKGREGR